MKKLLLGTSFVALLLSSAVALADPGHGRDDHGRDKHGYEDRNDHDRGYGNHHRYNKHQRHVAQVRYGHRRGDHAPRMYLQPRYYVTNYRAYHLAPPPRGYRWVRPDNHRYLLVNITTGLISQALGY